MKKIIKSIISISLLLTIMGFGTAQEIGLDSTTKTTLGNPVSTIFTLGERLDGWWKLPLDTNGSIFEGSAHFEIALNSDNDSSLVSNGKNITWVPTGDIDRLRLAFILPKPTDEIKSMNIELGRLSFKDSTGLVVSHSADGAILGIDYSFLKMSLQAGFTTLILRNANRIALSLYDQTVAADESCILGTSRLLSLAQIEFPDVYKQSVVVSYLAQQDMNNEESSSFIPEWSSIVETGSKGGKVDTQYITLKVSGPIIGTLFYDVWCTYGSGRTLTYLDDGNAGFSYQYVLISSVMSGFSVDYFRPELLSAAFNFRFIYASGDADSERLIEGNTSDKSTQFIPLTASSLGIAFSPKLSNLIVAELAGSVKPLKGEPLQTGLKFFAFLRPTSGPVDILSGLDPAGTASWLGFETDIYANYRIRSDLGISVNTGLFFPGILPAGAFVSETPLKYSIQLAATLGI